MTGNFLGDENQGILNDLIIKLLRKKKINKFFTHQKEIRELLEINNWKELWLLFDRRN